MTKWGTAEQFDALLGGVRIPRMYAYHAPIVSNALADVRAAIRASFRETDALHRLTPGQTVAVAVGSRELDRMPEIVSATVEAVRQVGGVPFIVPAMGSHGGATAEGQRGVLAHLGITEETMGCPVRSSMETTPVGVSADGLTVVVDTNAWNADWILPVNRVKPHTDFRGRYESGLLKMLAIGLGKQHGADICHSMGFQNMARNVLEFGKTVLSTGRVLCFVSSLENALHQCYHAEVVTAERVLAREPELLDMARASMPQLPFDKVDLIIVDRMGKDISGTGMDTNVVGRSGPLGTFRPFAERIVVFSLTDKTAGNANGMGLADIATKRLWNAVDYAATYPNGVTSNEPFPMRTPVIMPNDRLAYLYGVKACVGMYPNPIRIAHIHDTLSTHDFFVSEALTEADGRGEPLLPVFDRYGRYRGYAPADKQG